MKTLDKKLDNLRRNPDANDFIIADAKDADMAWGIAAPGRPYPDDGRDRFYSMPEFLDQMREMVASGYIDILLASNSAMSVLAHRDQLFADSPVTPAIRANDTTDVWISRAANYRDLPSRPFRSSNLHEAQYGSLTAPSDGEPVVNLGLYSITFNNDLDADYNSLTAFKEFRTDAAACGFEYFLEVFAPNVEDCSIAPENIPAFVNDSLVRALAGVGRAHWPKFLKIPYFGPKPMEELAAYDSDLIVGILGGGSGTTYDAFKQLSEAQKYGARVALYGRKIKDAEHPLSMVKYLRAIVDGNITAEEAVKAYHGDLQKLAIAPKRDLQHDSELTATELSYAR
ncbi:beta/alpha barrel domain-containing protein [Rhodopirellula sallentina]|uniref:Deoxyribose-phosphate aldolase/phospho-2-dehydro-3-deoxyheptonate aldolase n=1 Tax=Rhodopirellula sallentina SM41 TaxID=1263870 RepID=M5U5Y8_9BACT|nr:hypothetical protein [Rhodopirellula sallentina]EMI56865.1 hypothetical protein RSSM_01711 [Rhodopirellula sallentina SM41]